MHTHKHVHTPDSSLLCMSLPKADIFGLPCTDVIMPQAVINASFVHVLSKQSWRVEFRCLGSLAFAILSRTPSGIMLWYTKSLTTVLASISAINRSRYSFRTSSAVYMEREDSLKHTHHLNPCRAEMSVCYYVFTVPLVHINATATKHATTTTRVFLAHPAVLTWTCPLSTLDRTGILLNITG